MMSGISTAALVTLAAATASVIIAAGGGLLSLILKRATDERVDGIESELESLAEDHQKTRRLAETAYAGVYGDDDRPDDEGFVVSREEFEELRGEVDDALGGGEDGE